MLFGHIFSKYQITIFKDENYFFYLQNFAVVIFFTLAGFLLGHTLEGKDVKWKTFLQHKFVRIYKIYIPALFIIAILDYINSVFFVEKYIYYDTFNCKVFIQNLLMLQSMWSLNNAPRFGSGLPLWTMSLEWWYYVIFSFLYLKVKKQRDKKANNVLVWILALDILAVLFYHSGLAISFSLGIVVYFLYSKNILKQNRFIYQPLSMVIVLLLVLCGLNYKNAYNGIVFVLVPLFLFTLLKYGDTRFATNRHPYINLYSKCTFALYLIHYSLIELVYNVNTSIYIRIVVSVVLSNILAILLTIFCDKKGDMHYENIIYSLWKSRFKRNKK